MITIELKTLRELYRVNNKYYETSDEDLLDKEFNLAAEIDGRYWLQIDGLVTLATQKHLPVQAVVDALRPLGYKVTEDEADDTE